MGKSFRSPIVTKQAGEDLSGNQYKPVYLHTDGTVKAVGAGDTITVYGIQQNKPTAAYPQNIEIYTCSSGLQSLVFVYDTTAIGAELMSSANGPITATGSGKHSFGVLTETKDANNIGSVALVINRKLA